MARGGQAAPLATSPAAPAGTNQRRGVARRGAATGPRRCPEQGRRSTSPPPRGQLRPARENGPGSAQKGRGRAARLAVARGLILKAAAGLAVRTKGGGTGPEGEAIA